MQWAPDSPDLWAPDSGRPNQWAVLGHHLEQAHTCRIELGETGPRVERLAERAASALVLAGNRAFEHDDVLAAQASWNEPCDSMGCRRQSTSRRWRRPRSLCGDCLADQNAFRSASLMKAAAGAANDQAAAQRSTVLAYDLRSFFDPSVYRDTSELSDAIEEERLGDDRGLSIAWDVYGSWQGVRLRWDDAGRASERSLLAAERVGDASMRRMAVAGIGLFHLLGAMPVSAATRRLETLLIEEHSRFGRYSVLPALAALCCLAGLDTLADEYYAAALAVSADLGLEHGARLLTGMALCTIGAFERGEPRVVEALDRAQRVGDAFTAPTAAAWRRWPAFASPGMLTLGSCWTRSAGGRERCRRPGAVALGLGTQARTRGDGAKRSGSHARPSRFSRTRKPLLTRRKRTSCWLRCLPPTGALMR